MLPCILPKTKSAFTDDQLPTLPYVVHALHRCLTAFSLVQSLCLRQQHASNRASLQSSCWKKGHVHISTRGLVSPHPRMQHLRIRTSGVSTSATSRAHNTRCLARTCIAHVYGPPMPPRHGNSIPEFLYTRPMPCHPIVPPGLSFSCPFHESSHDILWSKKLGRGQHRFCAMLYPKCHWQGRNLFSATLPRTQIQSISFCRKIGAQHKHQITLRGHQPLSRPLVHGIHRFRPSSTHGPHLQPFPEAPPGPNPVWWTLNLKVSGRNRSP